MKLKDQYNTKLKILFVGSPYSSHAQSWLRLLDETGISVRLLSIPDEYRSVSWKPREFEAVQQVLTDYCLNSEGALIILPGALQLC